MPYYCVLFLQALRLFGLAAELEYKAAALKAEALQHLFMALAGSDCKELWTLLVHFFRKGTGFDPFNFLDSALAIKPPLDLGETDSDEAEESDAASTVTLGSASSTASVLPTPATTLVGPVGAAQASTSSAPTQDPRPFPKAKQTWCDKVPSINSAEPCIPTSLSNIHHTGIPAGVACKRSGRTTACGASLYICPHRDCGATPYIGDLYGCSSHLRRTHYRTCLACPYCPNQCYYQASGWKKHMSAKHPKDPWFGAPEATQASFMLAAFQEEASVPESALSQNPEEVQIPTIYLPRPDEISTTPIRPTEEEAPLEETLPFAPDTVEDDVTPELTPEQEQDLLVGDEEEEEEKPRPPTPSTEAIKAASFLAPSNLREWNYSIHGPIMSRYPKSGDHSEELSVALVKQDLPATPDTPLEPPPSKKPKTDEETDDGAPRCHNVMCLHRSSPSRCQLGRTDF